MSTWRDQADAFAYAWSSGGARTYRGPSAGGPPHKGPRLEMTPLRGVWTWIEAPEAVDAFRNIIRSGAPNTQAVRAAYYQHTGVDLGRQQHD